DGAGVAGVTVDDESATATEAGRGGEQLSPEAPVARRDDHHVVRPERIDGGHLAFVRLGWGELGCGDRVDRPGESGQGLARGQGPDLGATRLIAVTQPVEEIGQ